MEPGWTTVMAALVAPNAGAQGVRPVIVAARTLDLAGTVIDERGNPLVEARVGCRLPDEFAARFPVSLDASTRVANRWIGNASDSGHFELTEVGRIPGAELAAWCSNYSPASIPQPEVSDANLKLVLRRPPPDPGAVRGQVLDMYRAPVPGAVVCFGTGHAETDALGLFTLPRNKSLGLKTIQAMKRGYLPTRAEVPDANPEDPAPPFLYLYLGGAPLQISGRVVDADGNGVPRVRVWAEGGEMVPYLSSGTLATMEGYLNGGTTVREWMANHPEADSFSGVIDHTPVAYWGWVETDGTGNFVLGGLQEREYELGLFRTEGLQLARSPRIRAGSTGVTIPFTPLLYARVAGQVVGPSGEPVPDVLVQLCGRASKTELLDAEGRVRMTNGAVYHGPEVRTGVDGRFAFTDVGVQHTFLTLNGDDIQSRLFGEFESGLENVGQPVDALRIEVQVRMHLRIDLPSAELADRFCVLDAAGEPIPIVIFEGGGRNESLERPIRDGRTRVYAVSQEARTMVLLKGEGAEVQRITLRLLAGRVNVIRP